MIPRTRSARTRFPAPLLALLTCLLATLSAPVAAQGPGDASTKGVVIKGKAPVSREVLRVKLPRAQETTLKNGLRVLLLESHKVPTFSVQMVIRSGGLSDPPDHRGLAQFTASLLREGTTHRSSREIAEQVDTLGASLGGSSGLSSFASTVSASGLTENLDPVLELFADVIRNPAFPAEEVEKFKAQTLAQLQFQRSTPLFLTRERFNRAIYGSHPAGLATPPVDAIRKATHEALARFHGQFYRPNNAMLAVVGDLTLAELLPKIERAFGDWQPAEVPPTVFPPVPPQAATRLHLIDRPGSVQMALRLGGLSITRTDPDYFPLQVMNHILGGGPTSRLFLNIREEKGYTYSVGSVVTTGKTPGVWAAVTDVRTDVTGDTMRELMAELKRIRDEKVSAPDLENAQRALVGSFALSLEEPNLLLDNIVTQKLYDLPDDYWDTYPRKLAAVTAEEIQRVARKYLDPEHTQIIAVGDAAKTRDVLAPYAPVELYDTEGNPAKPAEKPAAAAGAGPAAARE